MIFASRFFRCISVKFSTRNFINPRSRSKLFIGGLCYDTNEPVLKNAFEKYGEIVDVKVICDRMSGQSKGYGFILFDSPEAASSAIASMNNQVLEGRNIRVEYAQPKGG